VVELEKRTKNFSDQVLHTQTKNILLEKDVN